MTINFTELLPPHTVAGIALQYSCSLPVVPIHTNGISDVEARTWVERMSSSYIIR
jgi:hypothetical protein